MTALRLRNDRGEHRLSRPPVPRSVHRRGEAISPGVAGVAAVLARDLALTRAGRPSSSCGAQISAANTLGSRAQAPPRRGPPRPVLGNSETSVGLEAASHTLGERRLNTLAVGRKARHDCILPTAESEDERRHGTERCHPEADAVHLLPLLPGSFYRFRLRFLARLIAVLAIPTRNVGTAHSSVLVPMIGNGTGGNPARQEDQHHHEHGRPSHPPQDTPPPRTTTSCREPRRIGRPSDEHDPAFEDHSETSINARHIQSDGHPAQHRSWVNPGQPAPSAILRWDGGRETARMLASRA